MKLGHWLMDHDISNRQFAKQLNVSQPTVGRWIKGKTLPDVVTAKRITDLTDGMVTPADWSAPKKKDAV